MAIYKQNIPQPTDLLAVSQVDLLNNFSYVDTFLDVEHQQSGRDNSALGSGRHKVVSMPDQGSAPAVPGGTTGILFQLASDLYHRNASRISRMTGDLSIAQNGFYGLPGGITIQWGTNLVSSTTGAINYSRPFNAATFPPVVTLTPVRNSTNVDVVYLLSTNFVGFTYRNTAVGGGITQIFWIAVGQT